MCIKGTPVDLVQKRVYSEQPTCCTDECDRPNKRSILDLQIVRGIFPNSKIFLTKFFLKVSHFAHFGHFGPSKRVYSREVNIMTCSVLLWLWKYNPLSKFCQRDFSNFKKISKKISLSKSDLSRNFFLLKYLLKSTFYSIICLNGWFLKAFYIFFKKPGPGF